MPHATHTTPPTRPSPARPLPRSRSCSVVASPNRPSVGHPALFEPILWLATVLLGAGVASGLPCVYSLPPEAQVPMTPWAITVLNAASTAGETSFPYLIGLAFEKKQ